MTLFPCNFTHPLKPSQQIMYKSYRLTWDTEVWVTKGTVRKMSHIHTKTQLAGLQIDLRCSFDKEFDAHPKYLQ